jgi:hypothetical protein
MQPYSSNKGLVGILDLFEILQEFAPTITKQLRPKILVINAIEGSDQCQL